MREHAGNKSKAAGDSPTELHKPKGFALFKALKRSKCTRDMRAGGA
jgi:hypothetical protein